MWQTIFVEPVLNLLIFIQNFMPGNDLGLAIFFFTVIVRMAMWPLIKKQIHQTRMMQKISPELTAIRAKAKGSKDRAVLEQVNKETMAVYKKYEINPFASIGTLIVQLPVFIAIYSAVRIAFSQPEKLPSMLYEPVKNLPYVESVLSGATKAVTTFADWADLALKPFSNNQVYVPVLIIALTSIVIQYFQVKQTMPAKQPKTDDPSQKLTNSTPYIMVILFGWISLSVAGAISFYLAAGALVAIFQQYYLMRKEKEHQGVKETKKPTVKVITGKEDKKETKKVETKAAKTTKSTSTSKAKKTTPKKKSSPTTNKKKSSKKKK